MPDPLRRPLLALGAAWSVFQLYTAWALLLIFPGALSDVLGLGDLLAVSVPARPWPRRWLR